MRASSLVAMVAVALAFTAARSSAGEVIEKGSKVAFPDTITLPSPEGPIELVATGTGLRTKFRFKVYACVSYVDATADLGSDPAAALITLDRAKQIHMKFRRDVDHEKVVNAFREGLEKNAGDRLAPLEDVEARFLAQFVDDLKKNDTLTLTYLPGRGLISSYNGKELGAIDDEEFASFVWAIYFGDEPVSGKMKKQMVELVATGS
jgi:hypothetical protein